MKKIIGAIKYLVGDQFGLNGLKAVSAVRGVPRYIRDYFRFRNQYDGNLVPMPCLHDWSAEGGNARGEYFWQDLWVARKIYERNPERHVDVGSRIDGFVAHVASYRQIEVFDIRPIAVSIPGVVFRQADIMNKNSEFSDYCDSLSCLHVLEHFGLGRYGDPVDVSGHKSGLKNMALMVRDGGYLYLSVPVGQERVYFNAHRVFNPTTIITIAGENNLYLEEFSLIDMNDKLQVFAVNEVNFRLIGQQQYGLGIFVFRKNLRANGY
jgi:Caenorhabditis protein of unknown function, DUF268